MYAVSRKIDEYFYEKMSKRHEMFRTKAQNLDGSSGLQSRVGTEIDWLKMFNHQPPNNTSG